MISMQDEAPVIQNVSDTALWVAYYRARESARPNALFRDPLARLLVGERGQQIAQSLQETSAHTEYNVLIRTVIIDRYIQSLTTNGVECVVNLGAGLDTRPYRLDLPRNLQWIEVDYPQIITLKQEKLASEKPQCQLQRVALDLNDRSRRKALLHDIGNRSGKTVILSEGVLPYLTEQQVETLAEDLLSENSFEYWIADYISPTVYKYLRDGKRAAKMKNAPFQFYPEDWIGFFGARGWSLKTIQYLPEEGLKLGRKVPAPLIARLFSPFFGEETKARFMRSSGYMILERRHVTR
jgi:methyltransferase (TIGR00027 family)